MNSNSCRIGARIITRWVKVELWWSAQNHERGRPVCVVAKGWLRLEAQLEVLHGYIRQVHYGRI